MTPYGVCSDVHLHKWSAFSTTLPTGVNSRLQEILNELLRCAQTTVDAGGDTMIITGDLFHVRGSVAPSVLNPALTVFNKIVNDLGLNLIVLAGNHDLESKNSDELTNACEALRGIHPDKVTVVSKPMLDMGNKRLFMPWFDDQSELMKSIENHINIIDMNDLDVSGFSLFIHAPMNEVIPGLPDHGIDPDELSAFGFEYVFCGHYHNHKEVRANVFSVGALTHQTWGDVNARAGFMMISEFSVDFYPSEAPRFINYNDHDPKDDTEAFELCNGNYVKIKIASATQTEVQDMRNHLISVCGAKAAVVEAQPASKVVTRTAATTESVKLRDSIHGFIKGRTMTADPKVVMAECDDILTQVGGI